LTQYVPTVWFFQLTVDFSAACTSLIEDRARPEPCYKGWCIAFSKLLAKALASVLSEDGALPKQHERNAALRPSLQADRDRQLRLRRAFFDSLGLVFCGGAGAAS
jgi:hypothetical protein